MRLRILFFILICSFESYACDSIRVKLKYWQLSGSPAFWQNVTIDSIRDNQVVSSTLYSCSERDLISDSYTPYQWDTSGNTITRNSPVDKITYTYDSIGRLIREEDSILVGGNYLIDMKKEYQFTTSNKKSEYREYKNLPQGFGISIIEKWFYDSSDKFIKYEKSEDKNGVFLMSELQKAVYTTTFPDFVRLDSLFGLSSNNTLVFSQLYAYDKIGDTMQFVVWSSDQIPPNLNTMFVDDRRAITTQCGHTSLEGGIEHWRYWDEYFFDDQCRILTHSIGHSGMSSAEADVEKYYYGGCNDMILFFNANEKQICRGDTIRFTNYIFGGTPPYTFTWNQSGIFDNDTTLNPYAILQSTGKLQLTVTDANGNSVTDSISITVNYIVPVTITIVDIDTTSACTFIDITINNSPGGYYSWKKDGQYLPLSGQYPIHIRENGIYSVQVSAQNCSNTETDSINIDFLGNPPPTVTIIQGCNQLFAASPTANSFEWFSNTGLVAVGNAFNYFNNGLYTLFAIDSAGCRSYGESKYVNRFFLEPDFSLGCSEECEGIGKVTAFPSSNNYRYLWSNGDTIKTTNHLCNGIISVSVINDLGCVLTVSDTCPGFKKVVGPEWEIFPVPANGQININTNYTNLPFQFDISDVLGKKIFSGEIYHSHNLIELNSYTKGVYILKIMKDDEILYTKEIVIF